MNDSADISDYIARSAEALERRGIREYNMLRYFFPGSYKTEDHSIILDSQVSPVDLLLVYHHEYVHAYFSQLHYGEMIRRLEAFGCLMIEPLNLIRGLTIWNEYYPLFG